LISDVSYPTNSIFHREILFCCSNCQSIFVRWDRYDSSAPTKHNNYTTDAYGYAIIHRTHIMVGTSVYAVGPWTYQYQRSQQQQQSGIQQSNPYSAYLNPTYTSCTRVQLRCSQSHSMAAAVHWPSVLSNGRSVICQ
jgi:hypothetical protein